MTGTLSRAAAPFPPTPSAARASAPPAPPAPTPPAASAPLLDVGGDNEWDEDEKTTVFDRSHAESAQALLQKSPSPAAGRPAASVPPPRSTPSRATSSLPPALPSTPPAPSAPSMPAVAASAPPSPSVPYQQAPATSLRAPVAAPAVSAPAAAPYPARTTASEAPETAQGSRGLYYGLAAAALLVFLGFFLFAGGKGGGMLVSVAGPGGTAVKGVEVLLDGEVRCEQSTCKLDDLEAGSYMVSARADGYAEMAGRAFQVEAGQQLPVNIELMREAKTGIAIPALGPGLTLTVDGKKIGELPQSLEELEPGQHEVQIDGSDFIKPFEKTVMVKPGEMLDFQPALELDKGKVAIKLGDNAGGAEVTLVVNGKSRSLTPHVKKGSPIILPVEGKDYLLRATRRGYETFEEKLEFTVKEPVRTVTISLSEQADAESEEKATSSSTSRSTRPAPRPAPASRPAATSSSGTLNVNSIPVSNVIVDGRPMGSTPKSGIKVSAGSHTVVFVHPEKGRKVLNVTVKAGKTKTAAVRF